MLKTLLLASLLFTTVVSAKEIVYVGAGRYVCAGSDCAEFNAHQRVKNYFNERQDAENRDSRDRIKALELKERLQEMDRKYKSRD